MNFSTFLGHPGSSRFKQFKMEPGEESKGHPEGHQDPKSSQKTKRRKSQKKMERDNQRAAIFQKKKRDEEAQLLAASATGNASSSAAVTSTPSPEQHFSFSDPISENTSGLDSSANVSNSDIMNLDGNATLNDETACASVCSNPKDDSEEDSKEIVNHNTFIGSEDLIITLTLSGSKV